MAGGVLSVAGTATLRKASNKKEYSFAAIPMFFGIQQFVEGLIWLSLENKISLPIDALTMLYSFFSHVFWPIFVPMAVLFLELNEKRKKLIKVTQVAGLLVGFYLLSDIFRYPVVARVLGKHIQYDMPHFYIGVVMFLYLLATCVSSMLSSHRLVQIFGFLSFVTFVSAYYIHAATFVSVWCFFAAVLSLIVYFYFRRWPNFRVV